MVAVLGIGWFVLPARFGGDTTYVVVKGTSMRPHYVTGDIVAVRPADRYEVGDVVVYEIPEGQVGEGKLVMHRLIGTDAEGRFVFRGDNTLEADPVRLTADDIVGIERVHVPHVALVTRVLLRWWVIGGIVGVVTLFALWPRADRRGGAAPDDAADGRSEGRPDRRPARAADPPNQQDRPVPPAPWTPPAHPGYASVSVVVDGDGLEAALSGAGERAVSRQACVDEVDRLVRRYGGTALVVFVRAGSPGDVSGASVRPAAPVVGSRAAVVSHGDPHTIVADLARRATDFVGSRVLLVVTDDEHLADTARRCGAPVVSSAAWLGLVGV